MRILVDHDLSGLHNFLVRTRSNGGWRDEALSTVLDPSRFVLLVVCPDEAGTPPPSLTDVVRPWAGLIRTVNIYAAADEAPRARFQETFGRSAGVFLVRPDGYVGLTAGEPAAVGHLRAYCRRWLTAPEHDHAL